MADAGTTIYVDKMSAEVYEDLRRMARRHIRSSAPLTLLDTSGLVSDTWRRLAAQRHLSIDNRPQFMGYCSRVMRSVIVDMLREKLAARRGGGGAKITLNTAIGDLVVTDDLPLRVDDALTDLATLEPRVVQVVEMKYFAGYTEDEIAEALGLTTRTVQRDWKKGQQLLRRMLTDPE
jgi:RNA polymerase sigma factor (TIGR02999 family)